jgi:hypothetical protein
MSPAPAAPSPLPPGASTPRHGAAACAPREPVRTRQPLAGSAPAPPCAAPRRADHKRDPTAQLRARDAARRRAPAHAGVTGLHSARRLRAHRALQAAAQPRGLRGARPTGPLRTCCGCICARRRRAESVCLQTCAALSRPRPTTYVITSTRRAPHSPPASPSWRAATPPRRCLPRR